MRLLAKIVSIVAFVFLLSLPLAYAQQSSNSQVVTSPTKQNLNAIVPGGMYNRSDAWAVGNGGTILRWDGSNAWNLVPSPTAADLYGVSMASASEAWAVGGSGNTGTIIRWNGSAWSAWNTVTFSGASNTEPINAVLYCVSMLDSSFGWAVGSGGTVLVWDGTMWAGATNITPDTLRSVAVVGTSDAWAVGDNGVIMRWTGLNWTSVSSPTNSNLLSVFMFNATDGWAVGGKGGIGVVLHWDGSSWTRWTQLAMYHPTSPGPSGDIPRSALVDSVNATLNSVFVCETGEGWIAGDSGTVLYWNGTMWDGASDQASGALRAISVVNPSSGTTGSKGYAVGDGGVILGWQGHQWIPEFSVLFVLPMLFAVAMIVVYVKLRQFKKTNSPFFPS